MADRALGIVVGGGPAPGINGVISAATIEAVNRGLRVFGIWYGFELLAKKDLSCIRELTTQDVSRIHHEGGSLLRTSRFNPAADAEALQNIAAALRSRGIGFLVTIGGDDTATSAQALARAAGDGLAIGHVPKTIDDDLPLPGKDSTFGYESARTAGAEIVETLMVDAKTTGRWYFVVTMGRKAGHLALGIGVSSGATLTLIPEEFGEKRISPALVADIITGSILRRLSNGQNHGVAVLAEGLAEKFAAESLPELAGVERDPFGHVRLAEIDLGTVIKESVRKRLKEIGAPHVTIVDKDVGYELRCRAPIPFDLEYTRQLGYGVIDFLCRGGSEAMISRQGDALLPIPFSELIDPATGRSRIRLVDTGSSLYTIARKYMIRLGTRQLENPETLARIAALTRLSPAEFQAEFAATAAEYGW